jgi:hypothetical protein
MCRCDLQPTPHRIPTEHRNISRKGNLTGFLLHAYLPSSIKQKSHQSSGEQRDEWLLKGELSLPSSMHNCSSNTHDCPAMSEMLRQELWRRAVTIEHH